MGGGRRKKHPRSLASGRQIEHCLRVAVSSRDATSGCPPGLFLTCLQTRVHGRVYRFATITPEYILRCLFD
jgi:hypothetical protein